MVQVHEDFVSILTVVKQDLFVSTTASKYKALL